MKLIITADDFGITDAVTDGIIKCAREGVLTQTGLFSNMPGAEYAVNRICKECPNVCLGQDINLVCGYPVTNPNLIKTLVQPSGEFKTSGMHRTLDKTEPNHISFEEAYLETDNQIKKFIELVGKKPEYLSGHAYGCENTQKALSEVAKKYDVPLASDMYKKIGVESGLDTAIWNRQSGMTETGKWDFSVETQLERDPLKLFVNGEIDYLQKALKDNGIAHIHTHAGYVDRDLFRRSSFTLIRAMEQDFLCSEEFKEWIKENNVELVSIKNYK